MFEYTVLHYQFIPIEEKNLKVAAGCPENYIRIRFENRRPKMWESCIIRLKSNDDISWNKSRYFLTYIRWRGEWNEEVLSSVSKLSNLI